MASKYTEKTDPTNPVSVYDSTQPTFVFSVEISDVLCRNILSCATGFTDLIHLATTCRHWYSQINFLWKSMFKAFYTLAGDCEFQKNGDFKRAFWEKLQRERVVMGSEIIGAHVTNPAYYAKGNTTDGSLYGKPLYLKTVCWLENIASFEVFPGSYEIIWRIKQKRLKWGRPVRGANLSISMNDITTEAEKYVFKAEDYDKWIEMTTGRFEMVNHGLINAKFMNLEPNWQDGLWFDCVFIKPILS